MAFASAHNGGRSQVNPNFINNGGEYPFLNNLKTADPSWSSLSSPSVIPITPDMLDADGYPTTLINSEGTNTGGVYVDYFLPPPSGEGSRGGNYVILWDGNGTIYTALSAVLQSGSLTSTGGSGRAVVSIAQAQNRVGISSIGSPRITNLRVVHEDDEAPLISGEMFGVKFKERVIEGGFGVLRLGLNWGGSGSGANSSNLTNWYSRKGESYVWYNGTEMRSELYCGSTTLGAGGAYTASAPSICSATGEAWDGVLRDKTTFHILWDRSGFTNITGASSSGANSVLSINTGARDANGFTPGQSVIVAGIANAISSITWSGAVATVTTPNPHGLTGSFSATISGNVPSGYNGTFTCTVTGANTFTYPLADNPGTQSAVGSYTTATGWNQLNVTATVVSVGAGTVTVNIDSSGFTGTAAFTNAKLYHTNMTLDVDGTGPIQLYGSGAAPITPASNWYPVAGKALSLATLTYDEALNAFIMRGGNSAAQIPIGINNGVPPEVMVRLCAEVGAHPSFPVPFLCCTPATDFLPNLLWYIKNNAPSWMIPWIEGPNETWNPFAGFLAVLYANAVANAYGWGTTDNHNWYGKAVSLLGQIASFIFDDDRSKYRMMCGVQTGTGGSPGGCNTSDPRLSSAKYIANTGGLQATQPDLVGSWGTISFLAPSDAGTAAKHWVTHVTVANYFSSGLYKSTLAETGEVNEVDLAADYAGGDTSAAVTYADSVNPAYSIVTLVNGTPGKINWPGHGLSVGSRVHFTINGAGAFQSGVGTSSIYWVKEVVDVDNFTISTTSGGTAINISGTSAGTIVFTCYNSFDLKSVPALRATHINWKAWAQSFGIQKMCAYEGGFSPDYTSNGSSDLDELRAASKNVATMPSDPLGMLGATRDVYANFIGLTDETFTAEYPSMFQLGGKSPSNNVWSVLENVYISPNPPQWEAARLFNARKRRLVLRTG